MANSMATISRRLYRSLLSNSKVSQISVPFCTNVYSKEDADSNSSGFNSDDDSVNETTSPKSSSWSTAGGSGERQAGFDRPLENNLDVGVYKAIVIGQVGQHPLQKKLKSGTTVTLFSVGTGGIRNNRRPLENEDPREYANRCSVQWHRVSVYPERLGETVMKHVRPGSIVYLEGNLETKIFSDPITGIVRRIREIALRRNGRLVFLGGGSEAKPPNPAELKAVGYY